jgi:predicted nucleic acid-binding protein
MVICNTTPLINFAETGLLDVLEELFHHVKIPEAVAGELAEKANLFPAAAVVPDLSFVEISTSVSSTLSYEFGRGLHTGEAACLAMAIEANGSQLILDDVAARQVARFHGLKFTGTLGCLIEAKKRGILSEVQPVLLDLAQKARFWIHPDLASKVLQMAGEGA